MFDVLKEIQERIKFVNERMVKLEYAIGEDYISDMGSEYDAYQAANDIFGWLIN